MDSARNQYLGLHPVPTVCKLAMATTAFIYVLYIRKYYCIDPRYEFHNSITAPTVSPHSTSAMGQAWEVFGGRVLAYLPV
jgi:hypothetical protein